MSNERLTSRARTGEGVVYTASDQARAMVHEALFLRLRSDLPELDQFRFDDFRAGRLDSFEAETILNHLRDYVYCDPAVGQGIFPATLHRELLTWERHYGAPAEPWERNIFGLDVDPAMLDYCRDRLDFRPHLLEGDFLTADLLPKKPDVIIANPPYVRQELLQPEYKQRLLAAARQAWPHLPVSGRSDLYLYFILRAAQVLAPGGVLTFIVPNGWLDNDFGAALRHLLVTELELQTLGESGRQRHFREEVNTVIFSAVKRPPAAGNSVTVRRGRQQRAVTQGELARTRLGWYGTYLRCPPWLQAHIIENPVLVPLGEIFQVTTGIITGDNGSYYRPGWDAPGYEPAIRSPREAAAIVFERNMAVTGLLTERVPFPIRRAPLLWTDLRGGRHLVVWNRDNLPFEHTFYGLTPCDGADLRSWAAVLNSTWVWLMVELFGRKNLGGGAIRLVKSDLLKIPLPQLPSSDLADLPDDFYRRPVGNWRTELEQPDRQVLDRAVFRFLGLEDRYAECRQLTTELMERRAEKSRS